MPSLAEAIAESDPPPPNESTTCEWIILPLLQAASYGRREIVSRLADNNGQFPDYTILPDSPHTWFLEAKAWNLALQDSHAQQSLNYANQNGKRWVVLTNGQEWRLYDNRIEGKAEQKFVAAACLREVDAFTGLITALSRSSVTASGLEAYAQSTRLEAFLDDALRDESSEAIRSIWILARKLPGLERVTRAEVVRALENLATPHCGHPVTRPELAPQTHGHDTTVGGGVSPQPDRFYSLPELLSDSDSLVTSCIPAAMTLPSGDECPVASWKEVAITSLHFLAALGPTPPLPFYGSRNGNCHYLHTSPTHKDGLTRPNVAIEWGGQPVFVHTNRSARDLVKMTRETCDSVGVEPESIRVRMKPKGPKSES